LKHYKLDVPEHSDFQNMSILSELCRGLTDSGKSKIYPLIDRLICLVLTLHVSTATTERAFYAMKLIKTRLRSRMEDEFLADNMVVYIEKEIAKNFTSEMIMDEFYSISNRRRAYFEGELKLCFLGSFFFVYVYRKIGNLCFSKESYLFYDM
jgi:hypothetical protein